MRAIFISYRRDDSEGEAGRLFDDLVEHFGEDAVFMDVTTIAPGRDFRKAIDESVATCGVLLAVIGQNWAEARNAAGARRLDDPTDFVRLETASALKRDIPVVPVLIRGARMPSPEQLPDDVKDLAYRNGVELTHARWTSDVQLLLRALRPLVPDLSAGGATAKNSPSPRPTTSAPVDVAPSRVPGPVGTGVGDRQPGAVGGVGSGSLPSRSRQMKWLAVGGGLLMVLGVAGYGAYSAFTGTEPSNMISSAPPKMKRPSVGPRPSGQSLLRRKPISREMQPSSRRTKPPPSGRLRTKRLPTKRPPTKPKPIAVVRSLRHARRPRRRPQLRKRPPTKPKPIAVVRPRKHNAERRTRKQPLTRLPPTERTRKGPPRRDPPNRCRPAVCALRPLPDRTERSSLQPLAPISARAAFESRRQDRPSAAATFRFPRASRWSRRMEGRSKAKPPARTGPSSFAYRRAPSATAFASAATVNRLAPTGRVRTSSNGALASPRAA